MYGGTETLYRPRYYSHYYYSSRRSAYFQEAIAKVDRASQWFRYRRMYLQKHPSVKHSRLRHRQMVCVKILRRKLNHAKRKYRRLRKKNRRRYKYASKKTKKQFKRDEYTHHWYISQIRKKIKWLKVGTEIRMRTCTDDSVPTTVSLEPDDFKHGPDVLSKAVTDSITVSGIKWSNVVQSKFVTAVSREDFVKTVVILQSIFHNAKISNLGKSKLALLTYYFNYFRSNRTIRKYRVVIPLYYDPQKLPEERIKKLRKYPSRKLFGWYMNHAKHISIRIAPL